MPKIVTTIVKSSALAPWLIMVEPHLSQNFTQEEIDTVVTPYLQYIQSLPGYIYAPNNSNISMNKNVLTITKEFDTIQNLIDATRKLVGPNVTEPVVLARNALMKQKMDASEYSYMYNETIEP